VGRVAQRVFGVGFQAGDPAAGPGQPHQAEAGDLANLPLARMLAAGIVNPALRARAAALEDPAGR